MDQSTILNTLLSLVQISREASFAPQMLNQVIGQLMEWLEDRYEEFGSLEGHDGGVKVLNCIELFHLSLQHLSDFQSSPSPSKLEMCLALAYQAEDELSEVTDSQVLSDLWAA
ncbi:MAG: hypothetical protein AMXMBFR33_66950 [Candidatus Xenobia bacterium]